MKENKTLEKVKHLFLTQCNNFYCWFIDKERPRSRLNKKVFFNDSLKFIGLILVFLIIYTNIDKLNQVVLVFIKIGSLLELFLLFFIIREAWHLSINLKYAFRGLNNGTKASIAIAVVLLLLFAFFDQDNVVNSISETYNKANFSKLNPLNASIDGLSMDLKGIFKNLDSCPQMNVTMVDTYWGEPSISGKTYEGWTIKGIATCKKGNKEGENLNHYYCGGYMSTFGIGTVNAYVEKTIISEEGDIGKTYKHVIWNTYDENKNFLETKCLGDPDEFNRKQVEEFERELSRWRQ